MWQNETPFNICRVNDCYRRKVSGHGHINTNESAYLDEHRVEWAIDGVHISFEIFVDELEDQGQASVGLDDVFEAAMKKRKINHGAREQRVLTQRCWDAATL